MSLLVRAWQYGIFPDRSLRTTILRFLHDEDALPQTFQARAGGVAEPWSIKADAEELHNKWCLEEFDPDLLRGIH
ncbi:hypothetical protein LTR56_027397 [Elasticomyces elasticus]|nr:hypothetical protein LTR56_027397 [Elasticomyces elasticus]KAK3633186.1 hypothetical protein LTR22_020262 [Elasticomyces elasticus]KAK4922373.1 hypothetical protein LTR49_010238 [Elasticomyces elasticus]KAK5765254.1 hypothetical protein LTS12_004511 [Elasticomyces elasticus]